MKYVGNMGASMLPMDIGMVDVPILPTYIPAGTYQLRAPEESHLAIAVAIIGGHAKNSPTRRRLRRAGRRMWHHLNAR